MQAATRTAANRRRANIATTALRALGQVKIFERVRAGSPCCLHVTRQCASRYPARGEIDVEMEAVAIKISKTTRGSPESVPSRSCKNWQQINLPTTGGASDIVKEESSGKVLVSNLPHPGIKKTRNTLEKIPGQLEASFLIFLTLGLIKQKNSHMYRVVATVRDSLLSSHHPLICPLIIECPAKSNFPPFL